MLTTTDQDFICQQIDATTILSQTLIQKLWSDYGVLLKLQTNSPTHQSVIVKKISLPKIQHHPRGWNTDVSHQRKIKSYQVETNFYQHYNEHSSTHCYYPKYLGSMSSENETLITLEDLDALGFNKRCDFLSFDEAKICIKWLAHFHGKFLNITPTGLWDTGTYWHLATRLDELDAINDPVLKKAAPLIDKKLNQCEFKTIVHGDAKVANFCFSQNAVAAVDFQYVGGGCGMKDLTYFLGSTLSDEEIENHEQEILNFYFDELQKSMELNKKNQPFQKIKTQWLQLYPFAWADFHRFLEGWRPGHWKLGNYSTRQLNFALQKLGI